MINKLHKQVYINTQHGASFTNHCLSSSCSAPSHWGYNYRKREETAKIILHKTIYITHIKNNGKSFKKHLFTTTKGNTTAKNLKPNCKQEKLKTLKRKKRVEETLLNREGKPTPCKAHHFPVEVEVAKPTYTIATRRIKESILKSYFDNLTKTQFSIHLNVPQSRENCSKSKPSRSGRRTWNTPPMPKFSDRRGRPATSLRPAVRV